MVLSLAGITLVGMLVMAFFLEPDERGYGTHEKLGLQPCLPMEVYGFPCPGCGVTTSVTHALHGDALGSIRVQPFGFLLVVVSIVFVVWAAAGQLRGRDLWIELHTRDWFRWGTTGIGAMVLAWVYKIAVVRGWF